MNSEHQLPPTGDPSGADTVLDHARLELLCSELDLEGVGEMADVFIEDLPRQCASCEAAFAAGSMSDLERHAHSLKGASSSFGLVELEVAAQELETQAEAGRADGALLQKLLSSAERARIALEAWRVGAGSALGRD